jgi:hypothetical protein
MLHAPGHVQQPVLPSNVPVLSGLWTHLLPLQQPVLPLDVCLFYGSLCCPWMSLCVCSAAVCTVLGGVWPAAACLCFKFTYLFNSSQCCAKRCMALLCTVCLQAPVLHRRVYLHGLLCCTWHVCLQELCAAHGCFCGGILPTRALCCTWKCLYKRTFAAPVCVCLQELCDAPVRVSLQESSPRCNCRCSVVKIFWFCLLRNRYVYLGCFDTCSKHRNKPK